MLLSIISSNSIDSVDALFSFKSIEIMLIILLSLKELLLESKQWNTNLSTFFNITIIPLFLYFISVIIFKIKNVI